MELSDQIHSLATLPRGQNWDTRWSHSRSWHLAGEKNPLTLPGFDLFIIVTNTLGRPLMSCCYGVAFWDMMPYILVEKYRHVGITHAVYCESERDAQPIRWRRQVPPKLRYCVCVWSKTVVMFEESDIFCWSLLTLPPMCVDENYSIPCHILWCQGSWIFFSLSISSLWICSGWDFIRQNYLYYYSTHLNFISCKLNAFCEFALWFHCAAESKDL